ncbi:MAG: LegC family aminotransferase [Microbacteriaceae bacterium]
MASALAQTFVGAIREVVGDAPQVGLHVPDIGEVEKRYVNECLDSTFVSSVGPFVTRFEEEIAAFTGAAHAIAVSNGTSALHVALVLAGVQPGDEVIVPSLSFIATANAVSHASAVPVFIDSDPVTMGMSAAALEAVLGAARHEGDSMVNPATGRRIAAVVPMHTLGHPVDIAEIVALADRFGIPVVEDAAESLGSYVGDRHTGTFGRLGILSFNGNKIITTGGGGMIITDDAELARRAKHLTTTAKLPHAWAFDHDEVAWNYRMPNLNAALGVGQLTKLDHYLANKRELARRYAEVFDGVDGLTFKNEPAGTTSNYWLCAVELDDPSIELRDELLGAAAENGLQVRPFWNLLSDQSPYRDAARDGLASARRLLAGVLNIPSSPGLLD